MVTMKVSALLPVIFTLVIPTIAGNCVDSDKALWYGSREFSVRYETIAKQSYGVKPVALRKFGEYFPTMTAPCVHCHADLLVCGAKNCVGPCAASRTSVECRSCVEMNCMFPYKMCVGFMNPDDLPIPPWNL